MNTIERFIRTAIKNLLPYGIVQRKKLKDLEKQPSFERDLLEAIENKQYGHIEPVQSKFKTIVSVQGFGYSGSGTVVDLLREYEQFVVLGYVSKEGSVASSKQKLAEIDFLRHAGGVYEVWKNLDSLNIFHNDALIKSLIKLINHSILYKEFPELRQTFIDYVVALIDFHLPNLSLAHYNYHLWPEDKVIYFLKKMPEEQFVELSRNFIGILFNKLANEASDYLVLDGLFGDFELNMEKNRTFVPGAKMILVTRDPRDLYAWAVSRKVEWIAHDNVENFIKWHNIMYHSLDVENGDYLVTGYENMVYEYDKQVKRIEEFLGIDSKLHVHPKTCFNPTESGKYVNIWHNSEASKKDFEKIMNELAPHCNPLVD